MAKIIKYNIVQDGVSVLPKQVICKSEDSFNAALPRVLEEAYNGEYSVEYVGVVDAPLAPRNIIAGEFITLDSVLYLATENIPSGEPVVLGQNAVESSIEKMLYELKGE